MTTYLRYTKLLPPTLVALFCCLGSLSTSLAKNDDPSSVRVIELSDEKIAYLLPEGGYAFSPNGSMQMRGAQNKPWRRTPAGTGKNWEKGDVQLRWKVNAPKEEEYVVVGITEFPANTKFQLVTGVETKEFQVDAEGGWERWEIGTIRVPEGESIFGLEIKDFEGEFAIRGLELYPAANWDEHLAKVAEYRAKGAESNFIDNVYGVMFHWGAWTVNSDGSGKGKEFPQEFADFDIVAWADMVEEMGAGYVIFTISWTEMWVGAPIETTESIYPGRTTISFGGEDYYAKMIEELNKRGIKFIFYYHVGDHDSRHVELPEGKKSFWDSFYSIPAKGVTVADPTDKEQIWEANINALMREFGERYGEGLYGWWFDMGNIYYGLDMYEFSKSLRAGNPRRIVATNNGKWPHYTEFLDYAAGEWKRGYEPDELDENGLIKTKHNRGLMPFGLVRCENHWATYYKAPKIVGKPQNVEGIPQAALKAHENGYVMTFNVMMYEDGTVDEYTLQGLKNAKQALLDAGIERDFSPINQD